MSLPQLALTEPLVTTMVTLLQANLNSNIDALNATITDGYTVPHVVQFKPYMPVPSTLQGGLPCVGVQRLGGKFVNDLQYNLDADHEYAVVAICQHADHETLVHQLERMLEAVAFTVHQDRLAGTPLGSASLLKSNGGAWAVDFMDYIPGPLLGDLNPDQPEAPPRSYLSWVGITFLSRRTEVG